MQASESSRLAQEAKVFIRADTEINNKKFFVFNFRWRLFYKAPSCKTLSIHTKTISPLQSYFQLKK